jgi:FlaA1/EpsC-like NDP-sugar epimerase
MRQQLKNPHFYLMIACDVAIFTLSLVLSYLARFDFILGPTEMGQIKIFLLWIVPLKSSIFFVFGLYRGMWRYTSVRDFWRLTHVCILSTLLVMAAVLIIYRFEGISRAVFLLDGGFTFLLAGGLRMAIRSYFARKERVQADLAYDVKPKHRKRVLIIGAGAAGEKMLREIFDNYQLHYDVVGLIDDDLKKMGRSMHGISVIGSVEDLPEIIESKDIEEVLISIPSASGEQMRHIVDICKSCNVLYKTLPGMGEIIDGRVSLKALRDVRYEDLLGRPQVLIDMAGIKNYIGGRVVLITGCGGSIGSELCRQAIKFHPRQIILLDASEANLFHIQMELHHELNYHDYRAILGRVEDRTLMQSLFHEFRPHIVFHAAAYKHVPLLEQNPWEAVKNNIVGSKVVMELAAEYNVERFVLVSTDKAVRPTNVMGASKRVTELIMQSQQREGTRYMAVRFGNVVGSSGSVIPLFRRQIEQGGPVTVTHPDVERYFMTIPEAVQLVIQAGAMGVGGEIFILKMGTPVKIVDMARDLIRLSGKDPEKDIKIIFTGLREGEKLYEELITVGEGIVPTGHEKIMVLRSDGFFNSLKKASDAQESLNSELQRLYDAAHRYDSITIKSILQNIVPEYTPQDHASNIPSK